MVFLLDRIESLETSDAGGTRPVSPAIRRVLAFMEEHYDEPLSLAQLAGMCNRSLYRFATVFRQEVGIPPHQYLCRLRIRHAQSLLRQGTPPTMAALESGFFDQSHLSRHFKRLCGVTPGQFVADAARERGGFYPHEA